MSRQFKLLGGSGLLFSLVVLLASQYVESEAATPGKMQRQVETHIANKLQPVVVTKVTLGEVIVQRGRFIKPVGEIQDPVSQFMADDDWVQNLTIYLLNRSNQNIVQAAFNFSFPETTDWATHYRPVFKLYLGRIPASVAFDKGRPIQQAQDVQPLSFRPGETMAIHLADYTDRIKADIEPSRPLAALTSMTSSSKTGCSGAAASRFSIG
jgi:hypothetical protein